MYLKCLQCNNNCLDENHHSKLCIVLKVIQDGLIAVVQVSPVIFVCPQVIMISFVAEISFNIKVFFIVLNLTPNLKFLLLLWRLSPRVLVPLPGSGTRRLVSEKS